jgi:hypothetical protein
MNRLLLSLLANLCRAAAIVGFYCAVFGGFFYALLHFGLWAAIPLPIILLGVAFTYFELPYL